MSVHHFLIAKNNCCNVVCFPMADAMRAIAIALLATAPTHAITPCDANIHFNGAARYPGYQRRPPNALSS